MTLDTAWQLVEQFAQQNREIPEEVNRGAMMIVEHLRAKGIPVDVHWPELFLSLPKEAEVRSADGRAFRAKPAAFSRAVPEGVTGELIYLSEASGGTPLNRAPADLASLSKIRGKIAVIEGFALPNFIAGLEAAGAIGVIAVNPGMDVHWGTVSTIWGTPELTDLPRMPKIPSVAVNNPDGKSLIAMAGHNVTLVSQLEEGWFAQALPVVEIAAPNGAEDFVLLHGHYDSWLEGVGDNGTGNACMLGVAEAVWAARTTLKRGVRLAWWPGHSTGRYGGSAWFADTFYADLDANCTAHLNCDSPGCRWATSYEVIACTPETESFVQKVVLDVTGQRASGKRPQRNSDYTFNNIGVSGLFNASSNIPSEVLAEKGYYVVGGCGGNIAWHTENDTIEIADRDVLAKDIALYTAAVLGLAQAEVVPFDWRATARAFVAQIQSYSTAAEGYFDLNPALVAAESFKMKVEAFYAALEAGAIGAVEANAAIKDLARLLIAIDFTRGPRFGHDPALNMPALPSIADATLFAQIPAEQHGFLKTQMLRGQNRLVDTLKRASSRVEL